MTLDTYESVKKELGVLEREFQSNIEVTEQMNSRRNILKRDIKILKKKLFELIPKHVGLTDHAILRYLERYHLFDIDGYKTEIRERIGKLNRDEMQAFGFVIKDGNVLTYKGKAKERK